jgi:hypothetical protein
MPTDLSPSITATSQQSRFYTATLDPATQQEVDLHGVTISVGNEDLLINSKLRLKTGVRYALVGRYVCSDLKGLILNTSKGMVQENRVGLYSIILIFRTDIGKHYYKPSQTD